MEVVFWVRASHDKKLAFHDLINRQVMGMVQLTLSLSSFLSCICPTKINFEDGNYPEIAVFSMFKDQQ
jgi:hypothetical protein